jgi:hypothetical protein
MDLIEFESVHRILLALFRRGRRGQPGRRGIDPIDDGLMVDADEPCDASEVDAINVQRLEVHPECHLAFVCVIAAYLWLWGVSASTMLALAPGGSTGIDARFVLAGGLLAGRTGRHREL